MIDFYSTPEQFGTTGSIWNFWIDLGQFWNYWSNYGTTGANLRRRESDVVSFTDKIESNYFAIHDVVSFKDKMPRAKTTAGVVLFKSKCPLKT